MPDPYMNIKKWTPPMEQTTKSEIKELRSEPATKGLKIIITGKGGAGKTTLTSLLAQVFVEKNYKVLAIDEDPQINLPFSLGYPIEKINDIVPLSKNIDYIEEKIGVKPGGWGSFLRLNPSVEDVVDRFGISLSNRLNCLVMGTISHPATGCLCPENALLDAVMRHIALREDELILLDTQAGVEHFGRALSKGFSHCIVVTDTTFNAISVAAHSADLAKEIGIPNIHLVINRANNDESKTLVFNRLNQFGKVKNDFASIFTLPVEPKLLNFEPSILSYYQANQESLFASIIQQLANSLTIHKKQPQ